MLTSYIRGQIKHLGRNLQTGESLRTNCPVCKKPEKSFSLTRNILGLVFNCYRATCHTKGIIFDINLSKPTTNTNPKFIPQVVTKSLEELPIEIYLEYLAKYDIPYEEFVRKQGVKYCREDHSLYFPLYNPWGARIGELLKRLTPEVKPKVLMFKNVDEPLIHFPIVDYPPEYSEVVLVEDVISAIKVSELGFCASLNGTHLSNEMISLLKKIGVKTITIMLDGDARSKAVYIAKELGPLFEDVNIAPLTHGVDPKDLSFRELESLIYR